MPYLGRSSDFGVRNVFHFLAGAGDTSVSGNDADGKALIFTDGRFVDVYLNGVRLKTGEDYNTATANTIAGISAMDANDEVNVVVFETFNVANTVPADSGGSFGGDVTTEGTFNALGDTAAGDKANMGFTTAEGLILTGQGTTNDVTIKNDADTAVVQIPTGTDDVNFTDDVTLKSDGAILGFGADTDINITHVADTGLTTNGTFTAANSVLINGTTPTLTIGDAGAEDTKIVFDGNAQDFHIGLDDSEDDLVIGKGSTLGTTTHMAFDENGQVTKPLQTYFHVGIDTTGGATPQSNISTSGYENITLDNEIFDRGGNFASNQFTAPVTGIYHLTLNIRLDNVDTASSYYNVVIQTSNRAYQQLFNYPDSDIPIMMVMFTAIADMDANDVAYARIFQNGGTAQTDINGYNTSFFGYLLG